MRRFGGILVDMFYDHFLAAAWEDHSEQSFDEFVNGVYASFQLYREVVPVSAMECLERMKAGDWLGYYRTVEGVGIALDRIGSRLRRPMPLGIGAEQLEVHYDAFRSDFESFFPEVREMAGALCR
jgi:acyl carrier protein phosphodiesterase